MLKRIEKEYSDTERRRFKTIVLSGKYNFIFFQVTTKSKKVKPLEFGQCSEVSKFVLGMIELGFFLKRRQLRTVKIQAK